MYTALNISSHNIKILSMKGRRVATWATAELAEGLVRDGLITQPEVVGETINSLFKSTGIQKRNVIVSIAGLSFTYRFINLPHIKPALLEEALLRAAKKEISLPLEELYVSWKPIQGKGEEQEYFIIGVPRNLVDATIQTLKTAEVEPYLMDVRPLALARAAHKNDAIVVDMEPDCFDIVFITNGLPTVIHTVSPRSDGATIEDNVHRLADELTKTATFYQSNHPEIQMDGSLPLLLAGELATDTQTSQMLQSEVEYPIEPLIPPVEFPDKLPIASYTTSIGLASKRTPLKSVDHGDVSRFFDIDVNIFEGKYRKPKAKPIPIKNWIFISLLIAVIACLFPLYQAKNQIAAENSALEAALNNIDREINLAGLIYQEAMLTQEQISDTIDMAESLETANNNIFSIRGSFDTELLRSTGVMPLDTSFTSIEIKNNLVVITGETTSVFTVIEYATALEAESVFSQVRITELDETYITVPAPEGTEGSSLLQVYAVTFEIQAQLPMVN